MPARGSSACLRGSLLGLAPFERDDRERNPVDIDVFLGQQACLRICGVVHPTQAASDHLLAEQLAAEGSQPENVRDVVGVPSFVSICTETTQRTCSPGLPGLPTVATNLRSRFRPHHRVRRLDRRFRLPPAAWSRCARCGRKPGRFESNSGNRSTCCHRPCGTSYRRALASLLGVVSRRRHPRHRLRSSATLDHVLDLLAGDFP